MKQEEPTLEASGIRLTSYSHGAGCGCKISPAVLDRILKNNEQHPGFENLLVGNDSRDDAAVWDLGNGQALISTTDFFMPLVDDPYEFGRIAATNAISDVYAMGGTPVLAIAILGWPIDKLEPEVAGEVIRGARAICGAAGIPLAGGHSIDAPEPVFGLAVNGTVSTGHLKRNNTALEGDLLFLTKPLGVGILSTAVKKGMIAPADLNRAIENMTWLNRLGTLLGPVEQVHALTDVTGFGLLGHLYEMTDQGKLTAEIEFDKVPVLEGLEAYLEKGCVPGGTHRNWASYGTKIAGVDDARKLVLADPQTSGGLLVAVAPQGVDAYLAACRAAQSHPCALKPIGTLAAGGSFAIRVS